MVFIPSAVTRKPGGTASLATVIASCVFDLDATMTTSYGGSGQTWANLIAAPADGAAQTDYDFYLGATNSATTDDPTFNGSAGNPAAYFSFDGGDRFSIKSGSNTSFLNSLHKTTGGADWTCVAALYTNNVSAANPIINTQSTASDVGMRCYINASEDPTHTQRGSASATVNSSPAHIATGTPVIAAFGHSHGTNKTKLWVNSTIGTEPSHSYSTTTASATQPMTIGWMPNSQPAENGMRLYAISMFNAYLSDGEVASVVAAYNARHTRTYI
ncbi:MAG TPA: hypothetical protein VIG74_01160 [Alphaproteobacteria bacterium]|jgi:hypothetical protein